MPSAPPRERLTVKALAEQGAKLRRGAMLVDGDKLYEVRALDRDKDSGVVTGLKLVDVSQPIPYDRGEEAAAGTWVPFLEVSEFEVLRAAG